MVWDIRVLKVITSAISFISVNPKMIRNDFQLTNYAVGCGNINNNPHHAGFVLSGISLNGSLVGQTAQVRQRRVLSVSEAKPSVSDSIFQKLPK